jgi:hypothetical protein
MFAGRRTRFLKYIEGRSGWAKKRRQNLLRQAEDAETRKKANRHPGNDDSRDWRAEIPPQDEYARAEHILTENLRSYVDDWLVSGRTPDGCEEPRKRSLLRKNDDGTATWTRAGNVVKLYLSDHPIPAGMMDDGKGIGVAFAEDLRPILGHENPVQSADHAAARLFVHFMDSEDRWQLAKCYLCRRYFYPERKLRPRYSLGAYCVDCRRTASKDKTGLSRKQWTEEVLKLAAEAWPKWKAAYGPRQRWVAMQVNGKLSAKAKRITGRWITQNDEKIKARAEAGPKDL